MGRPRKTPAASKPRKPATSSAPAKATAAVAQESDDDMEVDDDDDDDDDVDDDDDDDDDDVVRQQMPQPTETEDPNMLPEEEIRQRGAMDEESLAQNRALQQTLEGKANGVPKLRWNSRGALLYDGCATMWGRNVGDRARVGIDLVKPGHAAKDMLPLTSVPTYQDLFDLIKRKHWRGDECTFRWTIYTHGHCQRATDTISFEDDPLQKIEWKKRLSQAETDGSPKAAEPTSSANTPPAVQPGYGPPAAQQQPAMGQQPWQQQGQTAMPQQPVPAQSQQQPAMGQQPWQQQAWQQQGQTAMPQQPVPAQSQPPWQQPPWQQQAQQPVQSGYGPTATPPQPSMGQQPWQHPPWQQPPWQQGQSPVAEQDMMRARPTSPTSTEDLRGFRERARQNNAFVDDLDDEPDVDDDDEDDDDDQGTDPATQSRLMQLEQQIQVLRSMLPNGAAVPPPPVPPPSIVRPEIIQIHRPRVEARRPAPAPQPQPLPNPTWQWQQQAAMPPVPVMQPPMAPTMDPEQHAQLISKIAELTADLRSMKDFVKQRTQLAVEQARLEGMRAQQQMLLQQQAQPQPVQAQAAPMAPQAPSQPAQTMAAPSGNASQQPPFAFPGMVAGPNGQVFMPGQTPFAPPPNWQPAAPLAPTAVPVEPAQQPPPAKDLPEYIDQVMGHVRVLQRAAMGLGYVPQQQVAQQAAQQPAPEAPKPAPKPVEPEPASMIPTIGQAAAAVASATGLVPGAASNPADEEPFRIKEVGAYRVALDKTGKPMDWLTQAMFNLDNIQNIWSQASQRFAEARQAGEAEHRLAAMRKEMVNLQAQHQQQLAAIQRQMMEMQQQTAIMMPPPVESDEFFEPPLPPRSAQPAHVQVAATQPSASPMPATAPVPNGNGGNGHGAQQLEALEPDPSDPGPVAQSGVPSQEPMKRRGFLDGIDLADRLVLG